MVVQFPDLMLAHTAVHNGRHQYRSIVACVLGLARVEHRSYLLRVPVEFCEGGVVVAESGLAEDVDAVVFVITNKIGALSALCPRIGGSVRDFEPQVRREDRD